MSSEHLASAQNLLKGNLAGAWDILSGAQGQSDALGIARRFGGASAAYSLRDIGATNGSVVRVRRDSDDTEEDFSANQIASGALETFVIDGATQKGLDQSTWQNTGAESFSSTSTNGFSYSNSSGTAFIGVTLSDSLSFGDSVFISFNASGITHPASSDQSPQVRLRDSVSGGDGASPINQVVNGFNAYTLTFNTSKSNADHIVFSEGDTAGGTVTISDFKVFGVSRNGFVAKWYDQSKNGNDAVQAQIGNQPSIVKNGSLSSDGLIFDGSNDFLQTSTQVLTGTETGANSMYAVIKQTSGDAGYICGSAANPVGGVTQIGQSLYGASNDKIVLTNGNDATATGSLDVITRIESENYLLSANYSNNNENTLKVNGGTTGYANGSSPYDFNAGDRFTIGARKDSTSAAAVLFTGSMKEIIAYDADKTSDRVEIETEINNYYNLF
jgi:hypothetical protein